MTEAQGFVLIAVALLIAAGLWRDPRWFHRVLLVYANVFTAIAIAVHILEHAAP